ncbi:hypothetical protein As57867_013931, partial [Aphanomyces stellatus]
WLYLRQIANEFTYQSSNSDGNQACTSAATLYDEVLAALLKVRNRCLSRMAATPAPTTTAAPTSTSAPATTTAAPTTTAGSGYTSKPTVCYGHLGETLDGLFGGVPGYTAEFFVTLQRGLPLESFLDTLNQRIVDAFGRPLQTRTEKKQKAKLWLTSMNDPVNRWHELRNAGLCGCRVVPASNVLSMVKRMRQTFAGDPGLDGCLLKLQIILELKQGGYIPNCVSVLNLEEGVWNAAQASPNCMPQNIVPSVWFYEPGRPVTAIPCLDEEWITPFNIEEIASRLTKHLSFRSHICEAEEELVSFFELINGPFDATEQVDHWLYLRQIANEFTYQSSNSDGNQACTSAATLYDEVLAALLKVRNRCLSRMAATPAPTTTAVPTTTSAPATTTAAPTTTAGSGWLHIQTHHVSSWLEPTAMSCIASSFKSHDQHLHLPAMRPT